MSSDTQMPAGTPDASLGEILLAAVAVFAYIIVLDALLSLKRAAKQVTNYVGGPDE